MTIKQQRAAIAALQKDCQIRDEYVNNRGQTCAVGCLALQSGISKEGLRGCNGITPRLVDAIFLKFGLSCVELGHLVTINDKLRRVKARRQAAVAYLQSLPTEGTK